MQNGHGNQVLTLSDTRPQFRSRYETHVVMGLQRLDKGMRTTRVLASSLNQTGRNVRNHAWWSGHIRFKRRFAGLLRLHKWRVAVCTNLQKIRSSEANCLIPTISARGIMVLSGGKDHFHQNRPRKKARKQVTCAAIVDVCECSG